MRRLDYSWVILFTGFTALFFNGGSRSVLGLMLRPMTDDLGWSRTTLSLAITVFMVVQALSLPLVGQLVDRYNIRWIMGAGALVASAGLSLMGALSSPWQVFLTYGVVYALGSGATANSPVGVMISRWFSRRRGIANSATIAGTALGQLVIITLMAAFLGALGWRYSFALLGAVNFVAVAPVVLLLARSRPPDRAAVMSQGAEGDAIPPASGDSPPLAAILGSRPLWLLVVVYAVCGFQDFFVATHVVAFALDRQLGTVLAGNLLAWMGLMGLLGVLTSGLLADAYGASKPTVLCFALRIGIFALVIYLQDTPAIIVFALLYGFTFLITAPLTVVFTTNIFGLVRLGTVSGLISMVHMIFGGLGAFVGAVIFDTYGSYDRAFLLMLGLSLVAALLTLAVRERPLPGRESPNYLGARNDE